MLRFGFLLISNDHKKSVVNLSCFLFFFYIELMKPNKFITIFSSMEVHLYNMVHPVDRQYTVGTGFKKHFEATLMVDPVK